MRSLLFVPANVERYVVKAPTVGADAVILDLEDSVPEERKGEARRALRSAVRHLKSNSDARVMVRVNAADTAHFKDDVTSSLEAGCDAIVFPKCNDAYTVESLRRVVEEVGAEVSVIALIESARGVLNLEGIARSWRSIEGLAFGVYDYSISMETIFPSRGHLTVVKSLIAIAAKAYGLLAIDTPYAKVSDLQGLREESMEAKALGFDGKLAVHPSQVPVINEAFSPTGEEIEWARRVVSVMEAARSEGRSSTMLEGNMVDEAHYRLARLVLSRHGVRGRP
ncbi:MAG: CoA ester lyase [Thaumarchaeota archaeon]|nr:CoA ester lyase [Candidatus Calditenuaceae archaeon]MDW8042032.1 CoA ester lyase [Nitrososphaerota archaeon]